MDGAAVSSMHSANSLCNRKHIRTIAGEVILIQSSRMPARNSERGREAVLKSTV